MRIALPHGTTVPGLPIALGGLAISLEDLAKLYVGLANGGEVGPLRLLDSDPMGPMTALLTRAAAQQIGDILRDTPRPDGFSPARQRPVAYKTGTSYGFRDAWAVGYSGRYTVAVWVGRVEGSPRPGAFGINTAAPLLFRIFDLLPQEPPPSPTLETAGEHRLAPLLRRFSAQGEAALPPEPAGPRIVYPPPGATLDIVEAGGATVPIALEASGGKPPYRWIVNGIPLPDPPIGSVMSWVPDGPGFARISVTDSDNRATSEELRLE